jgi:hypothetical protein
MAIAESPHPVLRRSPDLLVLLPHVERCARGCSLPDLLQQAIT